MEGNGPGAAIRASRRERVRWLDSFQRRGRCPRLAVLHERPVFSGDRGQLIRPKLVEEGGALVTTDGNEGAES